MKNAASSEYNTIDKNTEGFMLSLRQFLQSGYRNPLRMWAILIVCVLFTIIGGSRFPELMGSCDTPTYFFTWDSFVNGSFEGFRMPLYPLIVGSLKAVAGSDAGKWITIILQLAVSLVAAFYMWRMLREIRMSDKASFWAVALWLLVPRMMQIDYDYMLMTESFSASMMIFLAWSLVRFGVTSRLRYALFSALWVVMLIMLRPGNLFVLPLTALTFIGLYIFKIISAKRSGASFLIIGVAAAAVFGYDGMVNNISGIKPLSFIGTYNLFDTICAMKIAKPEYIENEEVREKYEPIYWEYKDSTKSQLTYSYGMWDPQLKNARIMVINAVKDEPGAFVNHYVEQVESFMFYCTYEWYNLKHIHPRSLIVLPRMWIVIAIMFVALIYNLKILRRDRRQALTMLWCLAAMSGLCLLSFLGAREEWGRLTMPGMAFIYMFAVQLVSAIFNSGVIRNFTRKFITK